jgi:hypothetical protein
MATRLVVIMIAMRIGPRRERKPTPSDVVVVSAVLRVLPFVVAVVDRDGADQPPVWSAATCPRASSPGTRPEPPEADTFSGGPGDR